MGLFGSSKQKTETKPWKEQRRAIYPAWDNAKSILEQQLKQPNFQGNLYAGLTGDQNAGIDMIRNFANGQAGQLGAGVYNAAVANAGAGANFGANADAIYSRFAGDPTQQIVGNAGAYINNDVLQGQIDAANRDVARNLTQGTLPALDRTAAATGNMNSSRAGVVEALARRDAQDRMADTAAQMRGQAYQQGLGLAQDAYFQNANTQLAANEQVGNAFSQGINGANAALGFNNQVAQGLLGAGGIQQADQQAQLDANLQRWQMNRQQPWDTLNNYWGIVGSNNWGQEGSVSGGGGSTFGKIAGLGATLGAAYIGGPMAARAAPQVAPQVAPMPVSSNYSTTPTGQPWSWFRR